MSNPIEQEQGKTQLLKLSKDVYAEVSLYNGKTFVSMRRWFLADDGVWYRTKNGLHIRYDDMIEVLAQNDELIAFVQKRSREVEGPVANDHR